jgi:hypothetical protein
MPGEAFRITRDSIGDVARARADSLGFLPGVAARIFRDGAKQLVDSLYAVRVLDPLGRQMAFSSAVFHALTQSSIERHESRHIADARTGRALPGAEAEFRAKVDEVADAERPRLAMTAILSPRIGDRSTHGIANRRIMAGLAKWIRANGAAISGYDATRPALLQLPNLTDAQLRAAFLSMRRPLG